MLKWLGLFWLLLTGSQEEVFCQNVPIEQVFGNSSAWLSSLDSKATSFNQSMERKTDRYSARLAALEKRLLKKSMHADSATRESLKAIDSSYKHLKNRANQMSGKLDVMSRTYSGHLDSLQTFLVYLGMDKSLPVKELQQVRQLLGSYKNVQEAMDRSSQFESLLSQRGDILEKQFGLLGSFKPLAKWQKELMYYKQQMRELRQLFEQPSGIENKLLRWAQEIPAFQKFFNKYSALAGIYRLPGNDLTSAEFGSLQTREAIEKELHARFGDVASIQKELTDQTGGSSKNWIDRLKQEANDQLQKEDNTGELKSFKPNEYRTKTFAQRLTYDIFSNPNKGNSLIPASVDLGIAVGYKLNRDTEFGIGISGKLGLLGDWRHMTISKEGVGGRLYFDSRIKGSFWVAGGVEWNYYERFHSIASLKNANAWQESALLGIKKKYQLKKLRGAFSVQYDFLWNRHSVHTQPLVFRTSYSLK